MNLVSAVLHPSFHHWSVFMYSHLKLQGIRKQDFEVISGNRTLNNLHRKAAHKSTVLILGSCNCYSKGKHSNADLLIPDNSLYYFFPSIFPLLRCLFPAFYYSYKCSYFFRTTCRTKFHTAQGNGPTIPFLLMPKLTFSRYSYTIRGSVT